MPAIGPHRLSSAVVLAPMAGITDLPFRQLCRRFGAALATGEMITSKTEIWHSEKSRLRLPQLTEAAPRAIQIVGNDPASMAQAARQCQQLGAQIIDINLGCPAKKVCSKAAGSALMRDEPLVAAILTAVVAAVNVPVTLKMRTGWDEASRNAVRIARLAEATGIQSLAVHGRTRACRFMGAVEYDTIAAVVAAVGIPVFANGDINDVHSAARVLHHTGASGVMIGRGALGRPWLFEHINRFLQTGEIVPEPLLAARQLIARDHIRAMHDFYGEQRGLRVARKHFGWYFPEAEHRNAVQHFNLAQTATDQMFLMQQMLEQADYQERAA